jgi:hypothetical protein
VEIACQVQADLAVAKSLLILLSGWWASYTNNFVFTFIGAVPFQDLLSISDHLTQPFPASRLVLASGWSWVTFNGVLVWDPTTDEAYSSACLLDEVKRNLLCADLHFMLLPQWVHPAECIKGPYSSFSFTFLDLEGDISRTMA